MFTRLDDVEKRLSDIIAQLSIPEISANQQEFQKLSKEMALLRPIVDTYNQYKHSKKEYEGNKTIIEEEKDEELRAMAREEMSRLESQITDLESQLKIHLLPKDPNDDKNIFLEIRAGTGGEEAALFAADLFRMYSRYAEERGWTVEEVSQSDAEKGGLREMIASISGDKVYSRLKYESGTHRVQRVPDTEANGRIHTSAVTVAVLPEAEDIEVHISDSDLKIDVMRAGGAGGQHVNKTESAVRITHLPTGVVVFCRDDRSQHKNKAKAMKALRTKLLDMKQQAQDNAESAKRKDMVGSGDRSEKIRTYNFPQGRVTDHRIGLTVYQLETVINGKMDLLVDPLIAHYQAQSLKNSGQ